MKKLLLSLVLILSSTFTLAYDYDHHQHKMVKANASYWTLNVEIVKDTKDGYNLIIQTTNFKFAPEKINKTSNGNEGQAQVIFQFFSA